MNVLAVQNPRDLGNKNDSVTDNCRQHLTVTIIIILRLYYICVCALQLTLQVLPRVHN